MRQIVNSPVSRYFSRFSVLKDNQPQYWWAQLVHVLDQISYGASTLIMVVFLSSEVGWSDENAGYIFAAFSSGVTIALFFSGFITDYLGIRRSLLIAMALSTMSRLGILLCGLLTDLPGREWLVIVFILFASPAAAMTTTAFQTVNMQYSSDRSRGASFSLSFLALSMGIVIAGFLVDFVRLGFGVDNSWIFGLSGVVTTIGLLAVMFFIKNQRESISEIDSKFSNPKVKKGAFSNFSAVIRSWTFYRYILFVLCLLGVRSIFVYALVLLPKYWVRVIGEDVPIGSLYAVNPIVIIIGTLLIIPITHRFDAYKMVLLGSLVSASSLLALTLPYTVFSNDVVIGYLWMSILMMVVMSIGEVIWSPKLLEYTALIAPKGFEGSYLGLSMMPWFFAKLLVSALSGHMLTRWVPEGVGDSIRAGNLGFWDSPEALFLTLFFWAAIGPIIAIIFSGHLREPKSSPEMQQSPRIAKALST